MTDAEARGLFREMRPPYAPAVMDEARERLILGFLGVGTDRARVYHRRVAARGHGVMAGEEELKSEAWLAVVVAVDKFDPADGRAKFITYLWRTVWNRVREFHFRQGGRAPATARDVRTVLQFQAARDRLDRDGLPASADDVFDHLGWSDARRESARALFAAREAIHHGSWSIDSAGGMVLGLIPARPDDGAEEDARDAAERVGAILAALPPEEARYVRLRFGIGGGEPLGKRAAGKAMGHRTWKRGARCEERAFAAIAEAG